MIMTSHHFDYKGHRVVITVNNDDAGKWGWSCAVGSSARTLPTGPVADSEGEAIMEATIFAMRQIHVLIDYK